MVRNASNDLALDQYFRGFDPGEARL